MADKVMFVRSQDGEITAVFPELKDRNYLTCYAHIGQHSYCHPQWVDAQMPADEHEYADLLAELKSIGYAPIVVEMV